MREYRFDVKRCFTPENVVRLLFVCGCILRIWYAVVTPVTMRGHDIWELSVNAKGKSRLSASSRRMGKSFRIPMSCSFTNSRFIIC